MTGQEFNDLDARRYRQSGVLMAVGFALTVGALAWTAMDAASGGDLLPGTWLTVLGIGLVVGIGLLVGGLCLWSRTVGKALRRWQRESISDRMEDA